LEESHTSAERDLDGVYVSVGIHPNDLAEFEADPDGAMGELVRIAENPGVVGIGETGLDFFRERSAPGLQERAFHAHIDVARELDKALVIHCRDAHERLLEVLDDATLPARVIMHCFSGDVAFAQASGERGFFCSFAGNLTYKRNDDLRQAAAAVPRDLLLIETDAPFLTPEPHRGRPNSPALLPLTAQKLADVLELPLDELEVHLDANTKRAFGL
ncbi:MAG: TatD family hydrolase, partial [Actinobacteria bacterium]|nr:TatD family hydrolase [Actinomycetota bacterium]